MKKSIIAIVLILSTGVLSASTTIIAKRDTSPSKSFTKKDVGTADTKKDVGTADLKKNTASTGTKKDVGTAD
ncbi:hypothetical protein [Mucilaginibacter sp.]|jgi:hypothetical protein|uniref:hypothetical protein n=1 Tax=Mucilaginibacter sp. TaxID=1882438 RepID=UPI00356208DF